MGIYRVPCAGIHEEPVLPEKLPSEVECYLNDERIRALAVCPHCGVEAIFDWKSFYFGGCTYSNSPEAKDEWIRIKESFIQKYRIIETESQIVKEVKELIEKRNCPRCGKRISFKPGFFYYSDTGELRNKVFNGNSFQYDDTECLEQYRHKIKMNFTDIYSCNDLTEDFFRESEDDESFLFQSADKKDLRIGLLATEKRKKMIEERRGSKYTFDFCTHEITYEEAFELLRYYRKRLYTMDDCVDALINNENVIAENEAASIDMNKVSDLDIKRFLKNAIQIETDYYALRKRLADLYFIQKEMTMIKDNALFNDANDLDVISRLECDLKEAEANLTRLRGDNDIWKTYYNPSSIPQTNLPKEPEEPKLPAMEAAGLFNKKKVQAENETKMTHYRDELEIWKKKHEEWVSECTLIRQQNDANVKEAEKAAKDKALSELQNAEQSVRTIQMKITQAKETLAQKNELKKQESGEDVWDKDVRETEALLKKCVHAKKKYQASNVIFPKYQNLVAYSSFYEYLETGRCNALTGPDGAYNLYESEIRQNMIISQLSTVIDSLDAIKNNQYMVYTQLTRMNESLDRLNHTMDRALDTIGKTLNNIDQNVSNISEYTRVTAQNSEVIAYNTAVNAYYSKMNAELTDAMGYLIALS